MNDVEAENEGYYGLANSTTLQSKIILSFVLNKTRPTAIDDWARIASKWCSIISQLVSNDAFESEEIMLLFKL